MGHDTKNKQTAPFVGCSAWAQQLRQQIEQVSQHPYSVLITGPSGTGKEVVARSIHDTSTRADRPFIPVNCAAVPRTLFSSQLFGHAKGAFTGAQFAALGCFRAADGGTIFLDEIAELDLDCQAQLLRVLQEKVVTPVGSHETVPVNVRTIVATNRYLPDEVREGRFRLDLYYRLNVLAVETIGLAKRVEDIELLAGHFLSKIAAETGMPLKVISPAALRLLQSYDWPGNVRELQNRIERAVVHTEGDQIGTAAFVELMPSAGLFLNSAKVLPGGFIRQDELPDSNLYDSNLLEGGVISPAGESPAPARSSECNLKREVAPVNCDPESDSARNWEFWLTLDQMERRHIEQTLHTTFYNQSAAARLLNVDRKLLARKIKKYGIQVPNTKVAGFNLRNHERLAVR